MVKYLAELSKLEYSDKELAATAEQMTDIIDLMDTVKEFDVVYDDTKDNNSISYDEVRKDVAKPSFPTEKLLSNTQPSGNCYVVPKMVD